MSKVYEGRDKVMPIFMAIIKMWSVENKGYTNTKGSLQIPKSILNKCTKGCSIALEWQPNESGWTNKKGKEPVGFIKIAGFNQSVKE